MKVRKKVFSKRLIVPSEIAVLSIVKHFTFQLWKGDAAVISYSASEGQLLLVNELVDHVATAHLLLDASFVVKLRDGCVEGRS